MKILANRMDLGFKMHQQEYEDAALHVLRSGWYILGKELESFEQEFASFHEKEIIDGDIDTCNCTGITGGADSNKLYCAGVASGLDALWIGIKMLGIGAGDEVIVQGNTYIASVMGITMNGATPIFVEPDENSQIDIDAIEKAITDKTKAVMVVHLYGQVTDIDRIVDICKKHNLYLIEDCAQAHGAKWNGQKVGTFGDVGCFSFYPTKNMGAFGDAGAIIAHDPKIIEDAKTYRNYGSHKHYYNKLVGANSRLDEMQAALLKVRLKYMDEITQERRKLATTYTEKIQNPEIITPVEIDNSYAVWHQYVIRCKHRDKLIDYLNEKEIGSIIHYPVPPHLQEAYKYLGHKEGDFPITEEYANEVLSIPMYNGMSDEEQMYVIDALNAFKA
ncbi:dTDP-4-amino-4,6-dideoxygalactose transaminase [Butyrivibrio fibrisolvens DSM 3071]|uniref:dTDP-4-amino-4,6-dideoxygalactose transaminase n=1 Tax=Butyrivibrio fibrisolvens DSM 3071 TaxID=1121131 RepID=A0A1M6A3I3_BUTFI|nr:DegT/DnrJ/EryC1/StrS family aminotransferase [Butyrivibrio fibrisolvens]SHI31071.1 dTDP-4-amino-4,6-dideoxygalactose transaminase [Butyrivibrio fibrisolvens DSM 3071]